MLTRPTPPHQTTTPLARFASLAPQVYDLHAQYLEIFEGQITKFVERKTDYTVEEFFNECRMAMEGE